MVAARPSAMPPPLRALAALAALAALGCASWTSPRAVAVDEAVVFASSSGGEPVEGRVRCEGEGVGALGCSISHGGERRLLVCFHAELRCEGRGRAEAEACSEVAPGTEVRTVHAVEGCARPSAGRVSAAWIVAR